MAAVVAENSFTRFIATEFTIKCCFSVSVPSHLSVRSLHNQRTYKCCSLSMNGCEGDYRTPVETIQTRRFPSVPTPETALAHLSSAISELNSQPPCFSSGIIRLEVPIEQHVAAIEWLHAQNQLPRCFFSGRDENKLLDPFLEPTNGVCSISTTNPVSVAGVGAAVFFQQSHSFSLQDWKCIKRIKAHGSTTQIGKKEEVFTEMVKSIIGDEPQLKTFETRLFNATNLPIEIGLVIGKTNQTLSRSYIYNLIPTPQNDNSQPPISLSTPTSSKPSKTTKSSKPNITIDVDWVAEHARQVSRMLLGGVYVIGVYLWAPDTSFQSCTSLLYQVIKGVGNATPVRDFNDRIIVHFGYSPRKLTVRSCRVDSGGGGFSICDFKVGRVLGSLKSFKCMYGFELCLPVSSNVGSFRDVVRDGILWIGKELKSAKAIVDGDLVVGDGEGFCVSDGDEHNVELIVPFVNDFVGEMREEIVGVVVFRGFMCSYTYLNPKESVQQAISDIKGDIIMSLQSRLDIICDEAEEEMDGEKEESSEISTERSVSQLALHLLKKPASLSFPLRVLVPWIGDVYICDYLQSLETFEVVKDHCKELMCFEAPTDPSVILEPEKEGTSLMTKSFWEVVIPGSAASGSEDNLMLKSDKESIQKEGSRTSAKSTHFSTVTAIAILLLAIVIGFLLYGSR